MVFVNEKKYACEACIKGHRSSSCHHTERPLFEVKKKGRPVSQCSKCRELRQEKRVHSKCTCTPRQPAIDKVPIPATRKGSDKKPRRFMPTVPTLPNGISDALQPSTSSAPANTRQRVDSLLNPCHCEDVRQCTCRRTPNITETSSFNGRYPDYGLQALAEVAAMYRDRPQETTAERCLDPPLGPCCKKERSTGSHDVPSAHLELPPILSGPTPLTSVPEFPTIPPLSKIESIAGSGCTCGFNCTCPGCIEHRTPRYVEKHHKDCSEGCGHCVDRTAGIGLPGQDISTHSGGNLPDINFVPAVFPDLASSRRLDPGPRELAWQ